MLGMEVDRRKKMLKLKISPITIPWMAAIIAGKLLQASCKASKYSHDLLLSFSPATEKQNSEDVSRQYLTTSASTMAFGPCAGTILSFAIRDKTSGRPIPDKEFIR
jgi:hypothetical protein